MLTITVNDRPLDVAAIVERGRLLLPMRATFRALGASVRYDPYGRVIVARSAAHVLHFVMGASIATVDGNPVPLDVPAQIIGARTLRQAQGRLYVPLRFVAQAMGAVVGYDANAQIVRITASAPQNTAVTDLNPAPRSVVDTAYPAISATLGAANASNDAVILTVDGQNVTTLASFDGSTITYMPRTGLSTGQHTITFSGRTIANTAFAATWSFQTGLPPAPDAPSFSNYNFRFYTDGAPLFYPGDWMHFYLIAPPGGSAQLDLCGIGYQYGLWSSRYGTLYEANFPAPLGYWMPSCTVTAVYTSWSGQQYFVPTPVVVGLYTSTFATPAPRATSGPRPIPTSPRHPEPTHSPLPAPRPIPTHLPPRPVHTPHPAPRSTP